MHDYGGAQSYETLDWLTKNVAGAFEVRQRGEFDGVRVLEFKPWTGARVDSSR
jgi:hypothetical protein